MERLTQAVRNSFIADNEHAIATSKDAQEVLRAKENIAHMNEIMDQTTPIIEKNIAAMERTTAFSDGEMRDALSVLVAQTGDVDDAFNRMALAQDMARGTGMDLMPGSNLMGK